MSTRIARCPKSASDLNQQRPRELADLDARIERLRARQRAGDPDLSADELQLAIDRAMAKRKELEVSQPEVKQSARVLAALPKAAALYAQQISLGLDGDPRSALKARVILRQLFNGKIVLRPGLGGGVDARGVNATGQVTGRKVGGPPFGAVMNPTPDPVLNE